MTSDAEGGLSRYLQNKAAAMAAYAATFPSGDAARETVSAECTAADLTGARRIRIRDFNLISDSGPGFGGGGLGPSSPELILGCLASCLTHVYLIGAAQMAVPLDEVTVRFEAENNDAGFLGLATNDPDYPFNIRARVRVKSSASPDAIAALHDYAQRRCPLTRLVREPQTVTVQPEDV